MLCGSRSIVVDEAIDNKYINTINSFVIRLSRGGNQRIGWNMAGVLQSLRYRRA